MSDVAERSAEAAAYFADLAAEMQLALERLFPMTRSITGEGVRETLRILSGYLPEPITQREVPSGTQCFDWEVPPEWSIEEAWIDGPGGERVVDFRENNLHVLNYSEAVDAVLSREELDGHLYSLPHQPDAIPYVTSYYKRRWGFCLSHRQRESLPPGNYRVCIKSTHNPAGSLTYGEYVLPGETAEEVLISSYVCHPSMANNELSGPLTATFLARWLGEQARRKYTYRFVFIPETIGSIVYLSRNLEHLRGQVVAGYNLTCIGDGGPFSCLHSPDADTLADRVVAHVLGHMQPGYKAYDFLERGSDERQYCAPGVELPLCVVMRSKFGEYPEYHTSLDNLDFVNGRQLAESVAVMQRIVTTTEHALSRPRVTVLGEPQLSKRGLYPDINVKGSGAFEQVREMVNVLAFADGRRDQLALAERIKAPLWRVAGYTEKLAAAQVMEIL